MALDPYLNDTPTARPNFARKRTDKLSSISRLRRNNFYNFIQSLACIIYSICSKETSRYHGPAISLVIYDRMRDYRSKANRVRRNGRHFVTLPSTLSSSSPPPFFSSPLVLLDSRCRASCASTDYLSRIYRIIETR